MIDPSGTAGAQQDYQRQLRDMNEALLMSSVRQHELTEKAQMAEAALRASQEQLRRNAEAFSTLVKQSPYGIYVVDAAFRIAQVSTGAQAVFRNVKPLIGRDFAEAMRILWPEPFASEAIDIFRHTLETGETYIAPSLTEKRHDLETIESYEWQTHRVMLADGRFGVVCYFFDTTHLRQAEKALREQAAELADLHRRKDEFLAMLSHELRNPLAPITNALHLLRLQPESENQLALQARAIIERQVGQLKHLIDDLLEVSRITTGRVYLRLERVAVAGIVEHATETARPLIEQRRHAFTVSLPPHVIWIHGDAARLEQVVVNLLTNAAKYTDEGGQIWLTVQQEGDAAVLRVRDTGVGIHPDLLSRIFDLFTQADRSLARSEGGLGIGLSLVQGLVELHGGTVEASSVLGQGSEFVVRLPVMMLAPAPQSPETSSEAAQLARSLRVLVVDDNVDAAQSLAVLMKVSGHDVRMVHDGPAALEAALDYRPDVMLLDIGLPGLNGFEVATRLRSQAEFGNLVLVALTGYGREADQQQARDAGFDHHLVKPADFKQLESVLAAVPAKAS